MLIASANKVAKSYCGVATQGCVSFTETHEESNDMYGKKIKAEDGSKEKTCLPVDVMTLLAYQVKDNKGVERYLTKHGFKYEGRFVPEDLNPEFYFQKKYCVSVSAMQPFFYHYACYLCCNIIKTSKIC